MIFSPLHQIRYGIQEGYDVLVDGRRVITVERDGTLVYADRSMGNRHYSDDEFFVDRAEIEYLIPPNYTGD